MNANPVSPTYPSLRSALRLYLLVLLASTAIIVGLTGSLDVTFLRLMAAIFIFAGFTLGALLITDVRLNTIMGRRPNVLVLILSFVIGIMIWPSATWTLLILSQFLGGAIGNLPQVALPDSTTFYGKLVVFGVIIPLCESLLFFGFILSAALSIGRWRGILLTALLFGLFGLFSAGLGLTAIPAYILLGLIGSLLTIRSGTTWAGALMLSGFFLAETPIWGTVFASLLKTQVKDSLSFGWLTMVAVTLFITFALIQLMRALRGQVHVDSSKRAASAAPGRGWWIPLIAALALALVVGYGEIATRRQNAPIAAAPVVPSVNTGVTAPPVSAPRVPTSVTTQPANQ